jgi:hypothetical protein
MRHVLIAAALVCVPLPLLAQTAEGNATALVGVDNLDGPEAELVLQSGAPGEHRFGVRLRAGLTDYRFVGGHLTEDATTLEAAGRAYWSLLDRGPSRFGLLTEVGARAILSNVDTPAGDQSIALTTRVSPTFTRELRDDLDLFVAIHIDTDVAISPEVDLDTNALPTEVGVRWWATPNLAVTATGMVGGGIGYGGDGLKVRYGANLGVEYALDATRGDGDAAPGGRSGTGAFVDTGWRGHAIGGHLSHGPEVRAGVLLFGGLLKAGVGFIGRPGPLNPQEFTLDTSENPYRGQDSVQLRSDGATFGLLVAPTVPINDVLSVELPVTIGQAAYGFYLQGEDRDTPDGRRVSAWENELMDGRDSSFALGVDVGARLKVTIPGAEWASPTAGVHYLFTPATTRSWRPTTAA